MKQPARKWIAFASAALMLAILGSVALLWMGRPYQTRTLPDGSRVRLERVETGRTSLRFEGPAWRRALWELSGRQLRMLGQPITVTRMQDTLSLEVAGTGVRRPKSFSNAVLLDEHDCVFSGWQEYFPMVPGRRSGGRAELTFDAYPRQGGSVRAGFLTEGLPLLFDAPVPRTGSPVNWAAEPYPIRKKDQDLEFTLHRIVPAKLPDQLRPRAYFEVRRRGQRLTDWVPSSIRVSDGTGNSAQLTELAEETDGGSMFPGLCTREPAWKLETWFSPTFAGKAAPDLEWTARNVELAKAGAVARYEQSVTKNDVSLEVLGTAGSGEAEWTSGVVTSSNTPLVRVRAAVLTGEPGILLSLVRVTDAGGAIVLPTPRSGTLPPVVASWREYLKPVTEYNFPLRTPAIQGKLNFTFRVQRMRKVDFLAQPPR